MARRFCQSLDSLRQSSVDFMGLDPSTEYYLGRIVALRPVYGWGWASSDASPAQINSVPLPFHCRIQQFFSFQKECRGAVALIEEPEHIYDRLWAIFYTRVSGAFDFIHQLPYCNLEIGAEAPSGEWPEFRSDSTVVSGYCFVGESLRHIEESEARMLGATHDAV